MKLSKTQGQTGRILSRILGPLLKTGLSLLRNVLKLLAKSILIPLRLTAAVSATTDAAAIHEGFSGSSTTISSSEDLNDIMNLIKSLEESGLLIKRVSKKIKNKPKEARGEFLSMLLGILGASLLGNLLKDKSTIRTGEGTIRATQHF